MQENKMLEIPQIPLGIKNAYNAGSLCLFLGAGVSRLAGYPPWRELCENIIKDPKVKIDSQTKQILLGELDNKRLLTLIFRNFNLEKEEDREKKFFYLIKEHLKPKEEKPEIYKKLAELRNVLKITTNADSLIDKYLKGKHPITYRGFDKEKDPLKSLFSGGYALFKEEKNNRLLKIHGTVNLPHEDAENYKQLIFTTSNYLKQYRDRDFQNFLEALFKEYTILFIGYGMSELELLQYLLPKGRKSDHFLLQGYYSFQKIQEKLDKQYFQELNIDLHSFYYDDNGHEDLVKVLNEWVGSLNKDYDKWLNEVEIPALIREEIKNENITLQEIEALFALMDTFDKEEDVLRKAYKNAPPKSYSTWLTYFNDNGYLKPESFIKRGEIRGEKEEIRFSYSVLFEFLIKILQECLDSQKDEIKVIFLKFINEYVDYISIKIEWHNPWADECVIRLIAELEFTEFTEQQIKFLKYTFENSQNLFHAIEAIKNKLIPKLANSSENSLFNLFLEDFLFSGTLSAYSLEKISKTSLEGILKRGSKKIIGICKDRIDKLEEGKEDIQNFWIFETPKITLSLNWEEDNHFKGGFIVFMLQQALLKEELEDLKVTLLNYLNKPESIYARIAIFIINHKYEELKTLFWQLQFNPFLNYSIRPELHDLLHSHRKNLEDNEVKQFLIWWNELDKKKWYEDAEQNEKTKNYQKQLKLALLRNTNGDFCDTKLEIEYKKLEQLTGKKNFKGSELNGAHFSISIGDVRDDLHEEILNIDEQIQSQDTIKKVLCFIKKYKPNEDQLDSLRELDDYHSDRWVNTLEKALTNDIRQNPKKYLVQEIKEFLKTENFLLKDVTDSWDFDRSQESCLRILVNSLKELSLLEIVSVEEINTLLSFLEDTLKNRSLNSQDSLISNIAELTFSICNKKYLEPIEKLLLISAEKTEDDKVDNSWQGEPFTAYLNAPRGKILECLMRFAFEKQRINENKVLSESILDYFQKCLNNPSDSDNPHLWSCLGFFSRSIYILNQEWFNNNIDKIFPKDKQNIDKWYSAFTSYSYMVGNNGLDSEFSKILINKGHYDKAIEYKSKRERDELYEAIASQVILLSDESSSLVDKIINKGCSELFSHFIWKFFVLFSDSKDNMDQKFLNKTWQKCLDRLSRKKDSNRLYESLTRWADLIKDLDDESERLLQSTLECYLSSDEYFDPFALFEKFVILSGKSEEQAEYVGEMWSWLLVESKYAIHWTEEMQKTFKNLEKNSPDVAKKIKKIYKKRWDIDISTKDLSIQ